MYAQQTAHQPKRPTPDQQQAVGRLLHFGQRFRHLVQSALHLAERTLLVPQMDFELGGVRFQDILGAPRVICSLPLTGAFILITLGEHRVELFPRPSQDDRGPVHRVEQGRPSARGRFKPLLRLAKCGPPVRQAAPWPLVAQQARVPDCSVRICSSGFSNKRTRGVIRLAAPSEFAPGSL